MRRIVLLLASVALVMLLASGVALAQAEDTTPPDTSVDYGPRTDGEPVVNETSAYFEFSSDEDGASFECKLDGGAFEVCESSESYYTLREGQHTFQVRATDAAGNVDSTPAEYVWEIDLTSPTMTWTERPGGLSMNVTNDPTPTWAYTFSDKNLTEGDPSCDLYDDTRNKAVFTSQPCPSPTTAPFELADGEYDFTIWKYDKAYNEVYRSDYVEVDTVAPKVLSRMPTGTTVSRYADVSVTFNDDLYKSASFVNIYTKGSKTPLAVYRYAYADEIEISPRNSLKRGTWYTVKVTTGVNDGANKLQVPYIWSFKTRG